MTKEHCVINGKRCSECCKVLTIRPSKIFREWIKYVRRNGYPDDFKNGNKLYHMLRQISKRRAKKINPYLVKTVGNNQAYFKCANYIDGKCSDYINRPDICSQYPYYGRSKEEFLESDERKLGGLYHIECTYYDGDV